jgi:hypothetical protein
MMRPGRDMRTGLQPEPWRDNAAPGALHHGKGAA